MSEEHNNLVLSLMREFHIAPAQLKPVPVDVLRDLLAAYRNGEPVPPDTKRVDREKENWYTRAQRMIDAGYTGPQRKFTVPEQKAIISLLDDGWNVDDAVSNVRKGNL